MTDKKTFGLFIKTKRTEKGYSQKELAEILFVTEGAVSKWERGLSYPDITMISDICRALDISEHEFVTASTDTAERKLKHEARNYRIISNTWFWVPTAAYLVALVTCFICNLAVNHTLSWFFIVLAALACAYTFVPTLTSFFEKHKLLVFCGSTYLSICLLLLTCAIYTKGISWFLTACIGVLIGYAVVFLPIILSKHALSRHRFLISVLSAFVLTVLLLVNVRAWHTFMLGPSILVTCYAFLPAIIIFAICTLRFDGFLKAGISTAIAGVMYYFINRVIGLLFGTSQNSYEVNFNDWRNCINGNVHFISIISILFISAVFIVIGVIRISTKNKSE